MKRFVLFMSLMLSLPALAGYTYTVTEGFLPVGTLVDHESLLMTGGGGGELDLTYWSTADIYGTTPYNPDYLGGIGRIGVAGYSHLNLFGGEIHILDLDSYATAVLSGGRIDQITSTQSSLPSPHITIACSTHDYNTTTKMLTGTWLDGSAFNIQLIDVAGYSKTIDNIKFIPEPASMLLVGLGGLFLRRKRSSVMVQGF